MRRNPTNSGLPASSSVQPTQLPATSQVTLTTELTTSSEEVLTGLCIRNCFEFKAIAHLSPCDTSSDCWRDVHRADQAVKELRQDMITHGIDRQDYIDLDDAITAATTRINSSDLVGCLSARDGSTEDLLCSIAAGSVQLTVERIAIDLGANP